MKVIQVPCVGEEATLKYGRFANRLIHYLVARVYSDAIAGRIETPCWLGETLFQLADQRIGTNDAKEPIVFPPFFQLPEELATDCFHRAIVQSIFQWRPEWLRVDTIPKVAVHVRRGDFLSSKGAFPVLSVEEIERCVRDCGFASEDCTWVRDDQPHDHGLFPPALSFLEDFQLLMNAENVFVYPASTFSWMAALMGSGAVYTAHGFGVADSALSYTLDTSYL